MPVEQSGEINIIAGALLQVGELVMDVSRDHTINEVWCRKDTVLAYACGLQGKKINEAGEDTVVAQCDKQVAVAFLTGVNNYLEYGSEVNNTSDTYGVRTITAHPVNDRMFVVFEWLENARQNDLVEDKWKLALDASGDGVWDMNQETRTITFSEKWYDMFGYDFGEITTIDQWSSRIHPDDIVTVLENRTKYFSGETPVYSTEMRYKLKDGRWKWILSRGVIISRAPDGTPIRLIGTHTDINERKIAEERYASTTQLLAKLINNLQTGIIVTDEDSKIVFVNDLFREMYAKDASVANLVGLDMKASLDERKFDYKKPELLKARTLEIFARRQMVLNEEWEMADGRVLLRDYIPLTIGSDNKGAIWKYTDITTQRNIDKRFEEQRLFYERILNQIPADIAVFDAEHRYLFVNKNAFKNDDLRKWMIGKTDVDYAQYSNRPYSFVEARFALYDGAMNSGEKVEYIEKLISKEGKVSYHLRIVNPVYFEDGSFEFLMAYGVQVTDLLETQEQLKTSIDTFTSAFDHSGVGMALLGLDGMWINANNVLCELTGYTKEELLQLSYHDITYPADDEMDRPLINQLLSKEISTYTIEKRYVSKDKKIVLVLLTVSLVWNEQTPKFFIAQVIDISHQKAMENDIKRKNMELEATRISLVNKITQLEELSHIIAHNLRGPAGNVKMFSEVLLAKQTNDPSLSKNPLSSAFTDMELVRFINESSVSLMGSLSTLMEITEIKLNKEMPANNCDVAAVVNGIATQLQSTIYEKNAQIILHLEAESVSYPKVYLENILYNLVSNALKYSNTSIPPEITISTRVLKNKKIQIIV
ncbi:MAG: domain S-box protein, partial [Flavipsychrobacter sp.]|nr:domain S-box protein [Flavipsychrobacter sp.]